LLNQASWLAYAGYKVKLWLNLEGRPWMLAKLAMMQRDTAKDVEAKVWCMVPKDTEISEELLLYAVYG
jgi:hypothetical protein